MRIIKQIATNVDINGITYPVTIIYKTQKRNITFRFSDGQFVISSPTCTKEKTIFEYLNKFAPKLLKNQNINKLHYDDCIYIFGDKYRIANHKILYKDKMLYFENDDEIKSELSIILADFIKEKVNEYSSLMNINQSFSIHIKDLKTRYGSFSKKTNNLSFNLLLVHYSFDIITSVVVHELVHYFVFDHSEKFYDAVLKYYPNYFICHDKLKKGVLR